MTGRRIAVVGGGASGITAGYALAQPSQMSMSVRCSGCGLQYAGQRGLAGLAAGLPRGRGRYLRMLAEVPRFHRAARRALGDPGGQVLADFLRTGGFSRYFTAHFALPLVAAVWSCPSGTALRYPARYLFAFLANHGMLSVSGSPAWRTVTGGSRRYVELAAKRLPDIRLSTPVRAVRRYPDHAELRDAAGETHRFDAVVIATHADQALRLLDPPTDAERDVLGAVTYTQNPPCCTPTPPCCHAVQPTVRRLRRPDQRLHTAPAETGAATECRSRNSAGKGLRKVCPASQPNSPPLA